MYLYQEKLINITKEVSQQVIKEKHWDLKDLEEVFYFSLQDFNGRQNQKQRVKGYKTWKPESTRKAEDQQECML